MFLSYFSYLSFLILGFCCLTGESAANPSADDCNWISFDQPLSHFARGISTTTFKQRVCVFDKYWQPNGPIFFYTGNESPVEEYVNNSGLQWILAEEMHALLIFAEHRYFGKSIPALEIENCMSYLSSEEALADFATLIRHIKREWNGAAGSAVISFGGSYGGMLSSWLRILYPSTVDGAISSSAPVLGFPLDDVPLDSASRSVTFAASEGGGANKYCANNLKMAWVLITDIGSTSEGRQALSEGMGLCTPLQSEEDVGALLSYLKSPLFDLAEGSYPFASTYLTFALTGTNDPLPPWAFREACKVITASGDGDSAAGVGTTFGIRMETEGSPTNVQFSVRASATTGTAGRTATGSGSGGTNAGERAERNDVVVVTVDWDTHSNNGYAVKDLPQTHIMQLLRATAQGVQVWYNVTGLLSACINWDSALSPFGSSGSGSGSGSADTGTRSAMLSRAARWTGGKGKVTAKAVSDRAHSLPTSHSAVASTPTPTPLSLEVDTASGVIGGSKVCANSSSVDITPELAWPALVCNEGMNLVNTLVSGIGNDLYWPPTVPRTFTRDSAISGSLEYCDYFDQAGLYGIPPKRDEWSLWLDTAYGGSRLHYASNIFFTNGNLDPWSGAGVPSAAQSTERQMGLDGSVVSRLIDQGGHHLDLFWPSPDDPQSVREVREEQKQHIAKWIRSAAAQKRSQHVSE